MSPIFYVDLIVVLVGGPDEGFLNALEAEPSKQQDTLDFLQQVRLKAVYHQLEQLI